MKGISLFSGAGIGEYYLSRCGIEIVVANELIDKRATLYKRIYPKCDVICGDITDKKIFSEIVLKSKNIDFLLASPPCQGLSVAGKNREQSYMEKDKRNYLVNYVMDAVEKINPKYVLIENVPMLLKFKQNYRGKELTILDILKDKFSSKYSIDARIVDSSEYGVPQVRLRAIIKMWPKNEKWNWPLPVRKKKTVYEAIGDLPSLEAGEASNIKWHFARKHTLNHIIWMRHTPTGKSAFSNEEYYPQKSDGTRIKGYESSYRRIKWDEPSPTITIRNDAISSQRNVHPGRLLSDSTYSDARVLTPLEIMRLTSLPDDWPIPDDTPEILIRQVIGESIPPLMIEKIVKEIECLKK